MKLSGKITISCPSGGAGERSIRLEFIDDTSRVHFLAGEMSLADFTLCIAGHSYTPITFELRRPDLVGMRHEHKQETVAFDHPHEAIARDRRGRDDAERSPLVDAALAPFEVEGWRGQPSDLLNHHRRLEGRREHFKVAFHRFVDPATGQPILR